MLTATKIQAVALQLTDGRQAVLVQDGQPWNGLHKFNCIAPPALDGQTVVAAKDDADGPLSAAFGALFDLGRDEKWVVVMCSPALAAALKRIPDQAGS